MFFQELGFISMYFHVYWYTLYLYSFLQDQLLFCDDCDRGYHMYCLKPPIKEPPEGMPKVTCTCRYGVLLLHAHVPVSLYMYVY